MSPLGPHQPTYNKLYFWKLNKNWLILFISYSWLYNWILLSIIFEHETPVVSVQLYLYAVAPVSFMCEYVSTVVPVTSSLLTY